MIKIDIYVADYLGFCGGVARAVKKTEEILKENDNVFINGMLIHNSEEVNRLEELGLKEYKKGENLGSKLILTTHGTHKDFKESLEENYQVYDTVCPYVKKVQDLAYKYRDTDLIIFGKKTHPEVISINSHSGDLAIIIENKEDLQDFLKKRPKDDRNYTVICQTTFKKSLVDELLEIMDQAGLSYEFFDTICNATKLRSEAAIKLSKTVDAMIVLGDKASSNCSKLYDYCKTYCDNVFFINSINEMDISQLMLYNSVGITAGASTPDWIIKEAIEKMEDMNQNEMMEAIESSFKNVKRGDILTGTVLYANDEEITVNIDYSSDGIIHKDEVSDDPNVDPSNLFSAGDEIEVYVLNMDDGEGNILLSHKRVEKLKTWDEVEKLYEEDATVDAYVTEVTKGGLRVEVKGLNGFMPASHVSVSFKKDLSVYLDEVLASKIIDFNKEKRRLIVSRKLVEQEELDAIKAELYANLKEGDIIDGVVQRLTNFGTFVDIGGMDGLVHISELSWDRVRHPSDIVSPGEEIQVKVLDVDQERDRVALSLKQLQPEPWDIFVQNNKVGDIVSGTVVNLLDFGAFVKLESGVDGLLHVSQIAREHVEKPSDRLEMNQEVEVLITDIDEEDRKISLSIKEIEVREARKKRQEQRKEKDSFRKERKPKRRPRQEKQEELVSEEPSFGINLGDLLNFNSTSEEEAVDVSEEIQDRLDDLGEEASQEENSNLDQDQEEKVEVSDDTEDQLDDQDLDQDLLEE